MARDPPEVLKDALALPPEIQAALIGPLIDSLDTKIDARPEEAWREEIQRRLLEIDDSILIPWDDARRRLLDPR